MSRWSDRNQGIAMQVAHATVKCRRTMLTRVRAGFALGGLALAACPSGAAAQEAASEDRVSEPVILPAVSGNETSVAASSGARHPPVDDSIKSTDLVTPSNTNMPDAQILATPEGAGDNNEMAAQTFQSADLDSGVIHDRNIPGVTKVTTSETPAPSRVTGVTLWDEIVPPTPPVPVGAAQTVPGGVASSGGK
jgi:hypothetical protein